MLAGPYWKDGGELSVQNHLHIGAGKYQGGDQGKDGDIMWRQTWPKRAWNKQLKRERERCEEQRQIVIDYFCRNESGTLNRERNRHKI